MSWDEGCHASNIPRDIDWEWENVKGDLDQDQALIWFTRFLANNPAAATQFLIGDTFGKLNPIQDIIIRTWFLKDYNLLVAGRGFSKSYTAALFLPLYSLFNPGSKIVLCSASFRQSKMIFETIEKFIENPKGGFLKQCCPKNYVSRGTDRWEMKIGKSVIIATPLTEKIRGLRAHLVVIDEYLSIPERIVSEIIMPFMTVKRGSGQEQKRIQQAEQILVDTGKLQTWEKTVYPSNKMIFLSSATYKFEPLYKNTYLAYLNAIHDPKMKDVNHSVFRLGYKAAPKYLLDEKNIEQARRSLSEAQFDREYNAIFTDESAGFYSMRDILAATVPQGENPKTRMRGLPEFEYIISVDPNFSAGSEEADNFAISVIELAGDGTGRGTLVHAYATAQSQVQKRVEYFQYLMDNFNVAMIILDNAGGPRFIEEYNALTETSKRINLVPLDFTDDETFNATKHHYDRATRSIAFSQVFNKKNWIADANNAMQGDIQHKRILFASSIRFDDSAFSSAVAMTRHVPDDLEFKQMSDDIQGENRRMEFVEHVDTMVQNTAKELALIHTKVDVMGNLTFDLAAEAKSTKGKNRARRDSYTSLLLGNYARNCYWKMISQPDEEDEVFAGIFLK